jgi:phenylacetate-CoA ligase
MACGLPIVTTDVGGLRSYVDETCARLVPPGDVPAMAQAVLELLGDAAARSAMGRAGRRRTEAFAWPEIARQVIAVYEGLR